MKLEICYKGTPIQVLGNLLPSEVQPISTDFTVKIDDKLCPNPVRDLIVSGLTHIWTISGWNFTDVVKYVLETKGAKDVAN